LAVDTVDTEAVGTADIRRAAGTSLVVDMDVAGNLAGNTPLFFFFVGDMS
jgi:hypothetical protein